MSSKRTLLEACAEGVLRGADLFDLQDEALEKLSLVDDLKMPVDPSIREFELTPGEHNGYVLFPVIQGKKGIGSNRYQMCAFAHAFRTRGYEPLLPLCDGDLVSCFGKPHNSRSYPYCTMCNFSGRRLFSAFGMEPKPLEKVLPRGYSPPEVPPIEEMDEYRDVPIADIAVASVRRSLARYEIDFENEEHRSLIRSFAASGMILTDAAHKLFEDYDIGAVMAWDVAYIYGGAFVYAAVSHDVPAYHVNNGYLENTFMFGRPVNKSPLSQFSPDCLVRSQLDSELSASEQDLINQIMAAREDGNGVLSNVEEASKSIDGGTYSNTIGLFSNLIWDASLEGMNVVFDSPFDWISTTVEWVRENPETRLIVKTHPAEAAYGTEQPVAGWIQDNLGPLPENMDILEPDTDVSPYELVQDIDAGIVYNSTIGLEMAYYGKPVIVAGDTHYRGWGFTFDPADRDEYVDYLEDLPLRSLDKTQLSLVRRYAYLLLVREQLQLPAFFSGTIESPPSHENLSSNDRLDRLLDQVLQNEPVTFSPGVSLE